MSRTWRKNEEQVVCEGFLCVSWSKRKAQVPCPVFRPGYLRQDQGLLKQKIPEMKQALIFILSVLSLTQVNHNSSLCLLKVSSGFNEQILDPAVNDLNEKQSLILIRVRTIKNVNQYKFTVFTLTPKELQYFYSASDNYQGYFIYRQRAVLVYGDDVESVFFKKTNKKKHFSFLSALKTNLESDPPFVIEPVGYSYISIDGKWKVSN